MHHYVTMHHLLINEKESPSLHDQHKQNKNRKDSQGNCFLFTQKKTEQKTFF